jgi:SAM-dependent methyltransferase
VALFDHAHQRRPAEPTPSQLRALEALPEGGSVLDVGCGAGAACMPLAPPASRLTGMDESADMLAAFARRCDELGVAHDQIEGRWPDSAARAGPADVVVCHHVLYNVPDIVPFLTELTAHATRRVVVEVTRTHPLAWMSPLWHRLHGLDRPAGPTADDIAAVLGELGIEPGIERRRDRERVTWDDQRVAFVRRRLCVGPERDEEIARFVEANGPESRELVTMWWAGGR